MGPDWQKPVLCVVALLGILVCLNACFPIRTTSLEGESNRGAIRRIDAVNWLLGQISMP